eukprot:XP_011412946.1 PREDICTED: uncharacterized protein LOC105317861 isoform X2 [Crassostrea gigas]
MLKVLGPCVHPNKLAVYSQKVFHIPPFNLQTHQQNRTYKHMDSFKWLLNKAYVNGKWISAENGETFEVTNPATGEVLGSVPDMNGSDTESAIRTAYVAFRSWKERTAKERSELMLRWTNLCNAHKEDLAKLITMENGKPLKDSMAELSYGVGFLELYAEEAKRVYGDIIPTNAKSRRLLVLKQPIGVCGMITPWNFPHAMITRKAAAAIAAGCSVVIKPAEDTPLSALALCQLAEEAGLPAGVLNVVTVSRDNAPDVGRTLCESPLVQHISFTGSSAVGKCLLSQSASTVKKTAMELGGNAPFLVFESADLEAAVKGVIACKFRCSGQTCVSANRIYVQEGIYDKFVARLAEEMDNELRTGDGLQPGTTQGPLINQRAVQKIDSFVQDAIQQGARLVRGGSKGQGNFYYPTLLSEVTSQMMCAREEIFGPIAGVLRFKTEDEAVIMANDTQWGLAGYLFSRDLSQIWRVTERLEAGIVGVNEGVVPCPEVPLGGWKESGLGREGGRYGIEEFLELKYVCMGGL